MPMWSVALTTSYTAHTMNKQKVIEIFKSEAKLAEVLGVDITQVISLPEQLQTKHVDEIIGAAVRNRIEEHKMDKLIDLLRTYYPLPARN